MPVLKEKQVHLEEVLRDKQNYLDLLGNSIQQLKNKNAKLKEKVKATRSQQNEEFCILQEFPTSLLQLTLSRQEEKLARERAEGLASEVTSLRLEVQGSRNKLEEFQKLSSERQAETREMFLTTK